MTTAASPVSLLKDARRVVVKVGSALVTNEGRGVDFGAIARWAEQIAALRALGKEVVFVSSGAIVEGIRRLGWTTRPKKLCELQAAAAVGQMKLAQAYEMCFAEHKIGTAQILLTHADLADRERYLNARDTLIELLSLAFSQSSTKTTRSSRTKLRLGTTTPWGRSLRISWKPTRS